MRITIKPPSPAPSPPLPEGALLSLRVETADPVPRLDGPVSIAYEGRYVDTPAPAFLFPEPGFARLMTATAAHSAFRLPVPALRRPYVDVDAAEGDVITATLTTPPPGAKTYSASFRASGDDNPVELTLAEGGAAPPGPPPPPTPQPAEGLTITPVPTAALPPPLEEGDVVRLDTAPGADRLVVLVPAP